MRVELSFSKQGNSSYRFFDVMKQTWPDMELRKLKGFSKYHLVMDAKFKNRDTEKTNLRDRIDETLGDPISMFYVSNLKIGKAVKCSQCNGTGLSNYPQDFFVEIPKEKLVIK